MALFAGGKRYCITVGLENMMKRGPDALAGIFKRDDGTPCSGPDAYAILWKAWLEGFEVLPVCNNHDEKGHCLGHVGKGNS